MTVLTMPCDRCSALVELELSCLLLAITEGDDAPGQLAYICPACREFASIPVSLDTATTLLAAGCPQVHTVPPLPAPDMPPAGPPLTLDDVIELHAVLANEGWLAALTGEQS